VGLSPPATVGRVPVRSRELVASTIRRQHSPSPTSHHHGPLGGDGCSGGPLHVTGEEVIPQVAVYTAAGSPVDCVAFQGNSGITGGDTPAAHGAMVRAAGKPGFTPFARPALTTGRRARRVCAGPPRGQ